MTVDDIAVKVTTVVLQEVADLDPWAPVTHYTRKATSHREATRSCGATSLSA